MVGGHGGQFTLVGAAIRRGDATYKQLVDLLRPAKGALPGSVWLQDRSAFGAAGASRLAGELAADPGLAELARLGIVAITVEPSPVRVTGLPTTTTTVPVTTVPRTTSTTTTAVSGISGTTSTSTSVVTTTTVPPTTTTIQVPPSGSRSYLLPTATIGVTVVVRNAGDVAIGGVEVEVTLVPSPPAPGAAGSPSASSHLGTLQVGRSVSVRVRTARDLQARRELSTRRARVGDSVTPITDSVTAGPVELEFRRRCLRARPDERSSSALGLSTR